MKKTCIADKDFIEYSKKIVQEFYKDFKNINFKNVDNEKISILKKNALNLLEQENITSNNFVNYIKKMKRLNINQKKYNVDCIEEKYILFMFSVDPTFEAVKIYGESNHVNDIKRKMKNVFELYDHRLISIEKEFIQYFLSENHKKEINEEIEKRVFK
ncbi:MAG: hypothetical protein IJE04_00325 [Bacilli bacterium]|nr:hypothetical protein [Bacilli bacterium]